MKEKRAKQFEWGLRVSCVRACHAQVSSPEDLQGGFESESPSCGEGRSYGEELLAEVKPFSNADLWQKEDFLCVAQEGKGVAGPWVSPTR